MQCKPPVPRKTSVTLIEEVDSLGEGGFAACGGNADACEPDDLMLVIPRPITDKIRQAWNGRASAYFQ